MLQYVQAMKSAPAKRGPAVIRVRHRRLQQAFDCDVAVCGGTLGLLLALALQVSLAALWLAHADQSMHVSQASLQACHAGNCASEDLATELHH